MKRLSVVSIALLFFGITQAQQNVGIGTTTPKHKLDVYGNIFLGTTQSNTSFTTISDALYLGSPRKFLANATGVNVEGTTDWINLMAHPFSAGILFGLSGYSDATPHTSVNALMVIRSSGNVGIGITNPTNLLSVAGNADFSGNVGIGTSTPANRLSVSGNADISGNMGIGTATPAASAQLDISSTTKGLLPPRMTSTQRDAMTPAEGLMIYNTTSKKPSFYNGTEWQNFDGSFAYAIGDNYQGGKIAYILQSGDPGYIAGQTHGLIAAASDQSTGAQWGCFGTAIPGADGIALGTGNQNTIDIMAGCATAGIAARLCGDLVLNGFSDWYLPSKEELNKLYINRVAVGGFSSASYWSSSEIDNDNAWLQNFNDGAQVVDPKDDTYYVRAVRAF